MKLFIKKLIFYSIVFISIISIMMGIRYKVGKTDISIQRQKHILFCGASHVARGINSNVSNEIVNIGSPSERYLYTYIKIKNLLEKNPQIDTIYIQCSSTDLWENTDYKYYTENEQSYFIPTFWMHFDFDMWKTILIKPAQTIGILLSTLIDHKYYDKNQYLSLLGGFINENKTYFKKQKIVKSLETDNIKNYGYYGNNINITYLREIIKLCNIYNIKPYLVHFPVYKPEYFYNQKYCNNIRLKYFADVDFLDYSNWDATDSERLDAHHLNSKGAERFTKELLSNKIHK